MASILGNRVARVEDERMLTRGGIYVQDLPIKAVFVHFVRSMVAHGIITSIDIAAAKEAPGVLGVFTADEIDLPPFPHGNPMFPAGSERPNIAKGKVRFVGEALVAIVAKTQAQAVDASELVIVEIETLPAVIDIDHALADTSIIHEQVGTNTYTRFASERQADFSGCELVLELRVVNQRINGAPMEPRSGLAYWEPFPHGDRLVHYSSCQGAHPTRDVLSKLYNLPIERVRAVVPDVGGGFGVKSRTIGEELTLGWLSREVGRPVQFTETRSESMMAMPQGRGQCMDIKIGGTREGRITAYQVHVTQDAGAYPLLGAFLPAMTQRMLTGVYDIENCGFTAEAVATNKISITAYRGAGRPEAALAIERAMDFFAAHICIDAAEIRRRNFIPKFLEPYTTGIGTTYDVGDYPEALRLVLEAADYEGLRAEQIRKRAGNSKVLMGIGIASYVEITSTTGPTEHGSLHLQPNGRISVISGATPYGQGHETTWKMIVADHTGLGMDQIDVVAGDTDLVPTGGITVGSRSVQIAGSSIKVAADILVAKARERAAHLLEASTEDVVLDRQSGAFHVVGVPSRTVSWVELANSVGAQLEALSDFKAAQSTFPFGAHLAVVEIDTETGKVTLQRIVAVDDAGKLLNPLIVEGQIHGGIGQGVAQALLEEMCYDEEGNPVTSNFADYPVISAAELPTFELVHMQTPTWVNPLGAKGAGESGTIGSIPAVLNAIVDALSPLGVKNFDGPATPVRVWDAINSARQA
jgi:aerobic carbon-monoxide dehydrogenase large subunit